MKINVLRNLDWFLLLALCLVPACGLTVLYSAGFDPNGSTIDLKITKLVVASLPFAKQLFFLIVGVVVMIVSALIPTEVLRRFAYLVYGAGVLMLIGVALFGVVSNGSRRWLPLGFVNIQPAEFVKLGVVLAMARVLSTHPPTVRGFSLKELIRPALIFLPPMVLIAKQPDLGTALVIGFAGSSLVLFIGVRKRVLFSGLLLASILAVPAWRSLHDYQKQRILSLINPDHDPRGTGYHINQSKIAVGSGELFGKGFMKGTQTQLEFLPEHTTDFIFSVLSEEWGFVGSAAVLFIYFLIYQRMITLAVRSRDMFSSLVIFGISAVLYFHTIVNIGMVIGVLPVVGIPLPLFSYGGSSVLSTMFSLGLVIGLSARGRRNLGTI